MQLVDMGLSGSKLTGASSSIENIFLKASTMKITAIKVAKLSSVNLVMYFTRELRLNMTIRRMKPEVHRPIHTRAGMKSQSLSLKAEYMLQQDR